MNATHKCWFCPRANKRGLTLEKLVESRQLVVKNSKSPTFKLSKNVIDLVISSKTLAPFLSSSFTSDEIDSDHKVVNFELLGKAQKEKITRKITDWLLYKEATDNQDALANIVHSSNTLETKIHLVNEFILNAGPD